jgi:hypothetical protein
VILDDSQVMLCNSVSEKIRDITHPANNSGLYSDMHFQDASFSSHDLLIF